MASMSIVLANSVESKISRAYVFRCQPLCPFYLKPKATLLLHRYEWLMDHQYGLKCDSTLKAGQTTTLLNEVQ